MPELPEVETVRRGLERGVVGRRLAEVEVRHPRAVRRHEPGADDFAALLAGRRFDAALRRGKYLWLPLDSGDALVGHLGMSGQLLLVPPSAPDGPHLRVRFRFDDERSDDRRAAAALRRPAHVRRAGGVAGGAVAGDPALPASLAHIALDPLDEQFDDEAFVAAVRRRRTGLKRALLDQTVISGIGNIYADEALWRAQLHWARPTETLPRPDIRRLLGHVRDVLSDAIAAGGTSFDALYVNVNGQSGWFDRSLDAYGRENEPCGRCGTPIVRESFMNRSSYRCPRCQATPRRPRY